jgi:hypothetical protein
MARLRLRRCKGTASSHRPAISHILDEFDSLGRNRIDRGLFEIYSSKIGPGVTEYGCWQLTLLKRFWLCPCALVASVRRFRRAHRIARSNVLDYMYWNHFICAIRTGRTLVADVREVAICSVAIVNQAWYEWEHRLNLTRPLRHFFNTVLNGLWAVYPTRTSLSYPRYRHPRSQV